MLSYHKILPLTIEYFLKNLTKMLSEDKIAIFFGIAKLHFGINGGTYEKIRAHSSSHSFLRPYAQLLSPPCRLVF